MEGSGPVRRLKQSLQPDVVSNSIFDEQASNEISRLETLCATKVKELAVVRTELQERTRWFDAMTIVVKYFVAQVHAAIVLDDALTEP